MTSNDSYNRLTGRRTYLKGCLAGIGTGAALTGTASASDLEGQYSTVVDIVDAGADPNGNESVSSVIQREIGSDTLLKFPAGEYYMDEQVRLTSFNNVGIVSEDGATPTIVPANYYDFNGPPRLFRLGTAGNPGQDLHFEGFHIDQRASDTGIRVINAEVTDGLLVKDVFIHGEHDSGTWGPGLFNIHDSNGEGVVDSFRAFDGGQFDDRTPDSNSTRRGASGINVNNHQGSLLFKDCVLGGFAGSGLYASAAGTVEVEGGWFENSVTGSIRLGVSEGRVENAFVVVDEPVNGRSVLQHPIRLDDGNRIEITNVTIDAPNPNGNAIRILGGVNETVVRNTLINFGNERSSAVRIDDNAGETTFENVRLETEASGYGFRILGNNAGKVTLRQIEIAGDASGSSIAPAIYCTRNNCEFDRVALDQPGPDGRRGLELRGEDYLVTGSEFEATNVPIVVHNADNVRIEDTYARAYNGSDSLRIIGGSGSVDLEGNSFPDGIDDRR